MIGALIRPYLLYGAAAASLALGATVLWQRSEIAAEKAAHAETRTQHAQQLQRLADLTTRAAVAAQTAQQALQRSVAVIDTQRTQELTNALAQNESLRGAVRAGAVRLRIAATCPARPADPAVVPGDAAAASVDAQAADLTPEAGSAVLDTRAALTFETKQLLALQDYARQCSAQGDKP